MAGWPTGWREKILRTNGIPKTQFALDVLSAWEQSTPTHYLSNNPLGMPTPGIPKSRDLLSGYPSFVTMADFYDAFKRYLASSKGRSVLHELIAADDLPATWRAIHALNWRGNETESDYPHALLDMVEKEYRDKITSRPVGQTKSTGVVNAPTSVHEAIHRQALALHHAATTFSDASKAIRSIMKGLN